MESLSLNDIFESKKPIIGMVHLKPLLGSPLYRGEQLEEVIDWALRDAENLEAGGVDGIIVENFWDAPFLKRVRNPITISAMTLVVKEIVSSVSVPVGVNFLRNSAIEAAAISYLCGGKFIRVNVFNETVATDSGVIEPIAPLLLRYMSRYNLRLGIIADINVKHGAPLVERDIVDVARDAVERGKASAIIITGDRTGEPPSVEILKLLSKSRIGPVIIGSGLTTKNIDLLKYANGAIVGTFFKKDGKIENPVDKRRVEALVKSAKSLTK